MGFFDGLDRRDFIKLAAASGGIAALKDLAGPVLEKAYAADPAGTGGLHDIEHFVFLMMENRSFDHYFGTMSGVRGFADAKRAGTLAQPGYNPKTHKADPKGRLWPFRLDTTHGTSLDGECVNDPTHNWGPQHKVWNHGRMNNWVPVHLANEGVRNGPATMGYYTRADIPVHWALADAFTVCDHYFCSVIGPTDPNRLYWVSGTIDPEGKHGGPLLDTPFAVPQHKYSWRTMPENLHDAGVSWKIYTSKQVPIVSESVLSGMMDAFKQTQTKPYLHENGVAPTYPAAFQSDVRNGRLPKVSWIIPPLLNCEHPALPPSFGAVTLLQVLDTLTSNPAIWEKTALIISYDENGGFYDHVPPPVPPKGEPGEWLTVRPLPKTAEGVVGPIGLGFRVPALVVSPYSRGGLVSSETFDHTSQLRLIERRFGVDVPNLSAWRRRTTGNMVGAFDFASPANGGKPRLKSTQELNIARTVLQCKATYDAITGTFVEALHPGYPVPPNKMPAIETTPRRRRPSGYVRPAAARPDASAADTSHVDLDGVGIQPPSRIAGVAQQMRGRPLASPEDA